MAFFQNASAFIDHDVDTALDNLFAGDRPALNAGLCGDGFDEAFNLGIRNRFPIGAIAIPARSCLLAEPSEVIELFEDEGDALSGLFQMFVFLPDSPGKIDAANVLDGQNSHRHSEIQKRSIDL